MSIETYLSIGALLVAIFGSVYAARKSSADIDKTKLETEQLLRKMLDEETQKRLALAKTVGELDRKFADLSVYVGELLAGIDLLIDQITTKYNDKPVWTPRRRKDDHE